MALKSSVVTWQPPASPGGALTQPRWLGAFGNVGSLVYSYNVNGGPNQATFTLFKEPNWRSDAISPGRIVQIVRGGTVIWDGVLQEPVPTASGINLTATGLGNTPQNYLAVYSTWTNQNDAVNQAISRGLRFSNPGVPSGVWLGQQLDSGAQTITDILNLFCTLGGYYWYVSVNPTGGGGALSVVLFPQGLNGPQSPLVPTRLITSTAPTPRNLGSMITTIYARYQTSANGAANVTYGVTSMTNAAQAAKYGTIEAFVDLSSAGFQTTASVQALLQLALNRFIPVSYSQPFTLRQGEMLTVGGQPVDLGAEQAGTICQALITDYGYGGDVVPGPITFLTGTYQWDDQNEVAAVTPFQSLDTSFTSILSALGTYIGGETGRRAGGIGGTAWQEQHPHQPYTGPGVP